MFAPQAAGPTVGRIALGSQLRKLREAQGITREAAGHAIRASSSKISRLECGRVSFKKRDVADLLKLYGVHDEQRRSALLQLLREANTPGWWHRYGDILPRWFEVYVGLEEAASRIRAYEIQFVPGLLQTESYARAVTERGNPEAAPEEIDRRVAVRMTRQEILTRPAAPQFWAVVDEEALRRPIGGEQVIRGQIEHLMEVIKLPNVRLRVMPAQSDGIIGEGGPFTILRFAEPELPDVVYLEHLTSAIYLDRRGDVDRYQAVIDTLLLEAGPPASTAKTLQTIRGEI
jgi:transcriptional regulator with XRE-family HTH domain